MGLTSTSLYILINASIQLQVVADHKLRFIHCYTGQVGSVHDQRVFQNICNVDDYFPENSHLFGDRAYFYVAKTCNGAI